MKPFCHALTDKNSTYKKIAKTKQHVVC